MKRRKFALAPRDKGEHVQADNRVHLLPEATRNFVRAAQTVGSTQRAIEELVRNSIVHGRAKEVNITFGTVNTIKEDGNISFLQVQDDGLGIDEASTREFIGILHCTSVLGNMDMIDRDSTRGLYRGEALKALAALSIEFRVQTTWAQMALFDEEHKNVSTRGGLTSAPSKPRRKAPVHNPSLGHSNEVEATIFSEKIIRHNEVAAFRSVKNSKPLHAKTGTSVQLFGLFHKHQVRLRHYQLASTSRGADQLHVNQIRSAIQTLALAYPQIVLRLYHTKSADPDITWMKPMSLLDDDLMHASANGTNDFPSQSVYRKAIKHRFSSLFGKDVIEKANMLEVDYAESEQETSQHLAVSTAMLKSDGVVHSSLFLPTSLGRWKVCGVLLQIPQDEESESSPLTRSRQNELIFVNQRLVQHHTTLADAIQKMLILYVPSVWSFLLHITCPQNDIELVIDETKSYSSVRQRDRLENLVMTAIIATLRDNGMRTSSKKHITQHQTSYTEIAQQLHSTEKEETGSTAGISNLLYRSSRVVSGRELKRKQQERLKDDDAYPNTSTSSPFTDIFLQSSHNVQDSDIIESDKFEDAFFSTTTLLQSTLSETGDTSPTKKMISVKPENGANPGMTWTRSRLRALGRDIDNISNASGSSTGKAIKISKDMLSRAVFVAQLDAKFIIVIMDGIICVVDQHAADERVGLERLESALGTSLSSNEGECEQEFFDLSKLKNINVHNLLKGVATEDLKPMILSPIQSTTIAANDELLKKWKFDFDHNPDTRELKLTATPCIGGDKVATQKDFIQFVQALSNGGSSTFMKPAFAKRVLASYACRYAIMFGDVLDDNDCKSLLSSLSKCALSFTCAHGRPSVIPLLDLNGTADGDTDQHSTGHNLCDVGSVADNVPLRFQKRKRNCSGYAQTTHNSI